MVVQSNSNKVAHAGLKGKSTQHLRC